MGLLKADKEEEVIDLLRQYGYWDNPAVWRTFGDREDNFSTFGNQSDVADAALVEKLVNSVDAVLMGECWSAGIPPDSPEAPRSIPEAVAEFIWKDRSKANTRGHISHWTDSERREISRRITLSATGDLSDPCFTVVDDGEGQTPNSMPNTLLSLDKKNKINVHFVQGKFNMGGTGALRFCGPHNLQLIISRRNPNIIVDNSMDPSSRQWGFTIIRRENPTDSKRVSTYKYLAPDNSGVLRFDSDTLPLFPSGNKPYDRPTSWGTAIKLYNYKLRGKSHILRRDGLLYRLDILLPGVPLPVRLHECRSYAGHSGSFDTTLNGLGVRLSDHRSNNLEPGFPTSSTFAILGQEMTAEVYAFKRGKADSYRKNEGIIFTVNGQTHGTLSKRFFSRKAVGMNRLEDSILVVVDCSRISGRSREDLFMNNRRRMEQGEFLSAVESEMQSILKDHQLLRSLRQERRRQDIDSKLKDSKPLQDILESIIRKSPVLASVLGNKGPLSNPVKPTWAPTEQFLGKPHPTYFRFRGKDRDRKLQRTTPINMRSRIIFETDVVNDYFTRGQYPGKYELRPLGGCLPDNTTPDRSLNLENGTATLNLHLPEGAKIGDSFEYKFTVEDETLLNPFINRFVISVGPSQKPSGGKNGPKPLETPQGLAIPTPILVYEQDWGQHGFNKDSAVKVVSDPSGNEESSEDHVYYINMDNIYLKTELKATRENPDIIKSRWQFGMALVGMALLRGYKEHEKSDESAEESEENNHSSAQDEVYRATAAVAPVLLPLIEGLGALSDDDVAVK